MGLLGPRGPLWPHPARPVSNPHRYGQKLHLGVHGDGLPVFQTLIGTVKRGRAGGPSAGVSNPRRYGQKVAGFKPIEIPVILFQTLIGTVKRPLQVFFGEGEFRVSNPHRYGQKGVGVFPPPGANKSFKPS